MGLVTSIAMGDVIGGDFQIHHRLGAGGMGVVFAASQITTGHQRAVKVMHSPFTIDIKARERFEQEARIAARIPSDHVVQVVAAGVDEASLTPWLAMELLQGQDLERHIAAHGAMPLSDVALVVQQLGHALAASHDVGVVHRDIKPENVFLSQSRIMGMPFMAKVLDFGIAKLRSAARSATAAVGTPAFMAPEQTDVVGQIGAPTDIWALGLVVYRMITGTCFWREVRPEGSLPTLWREILIDPIPLASERAQQTGHGDVIPAGFDAWLARCLEREPADRFPHARDAVDALDDVFRRAGIDVDPRSICASDPVLASVDHTPLDPGPALARRLTPTWRQPSRVTPHWTRGRTDGGTHRVAFREEGERIVTHAVHGASVLDVSLSVGIPHYHACGGKARCSTCRVVVIEGKDNLGPRTPAEQAVADRRGWPATTRLACHAVVQGPCTVRRLVVDSHDAALVDLRRPQNHREAKASSATVLAIRFDGVERLLEEDMPADAIHVLERCSSSVDQLVSQTGGRTIGIEGSLCLAAFPAGDEGVRRALRIALRVQARVRRLNGYLLKHFGVQVDTAAGVADGRLVEGEAGTPRTRGAVLLGSAIEQARRIAQQAEAGELLVASALVSRIELSFRPGSDDLIHVIDFGKSDVVYLVQESFDQLSSDVLAFAESFYDTLFAAYPQVKSLFEHTDMIQQRQMLMDTLAFAIRGLDDFAVVKQAVRELGERHEGYGVRVTDYKYVGDALLSALEQFLGDDFTPEVEIAWREIYTTLVRTMVGAA